MSVYTIATKTGQSLGLAYKTKYYIVGFSRLSTAEVVKRNVSSVCPKLHIEAPHHEDITHDINFGLHQLGILDNFKVKNVSVAMGAKLSIMKGQAAADAGLHVVKVDYQDFLMYPFQRGLGIILEYDLYWEDTNHYTFLSNIVDPSDSSIDMIVNKLKR